jgi:hypothetical protein
VIEKQRDATTVLLICREGRSRQVYQAELDDTGVSPVCVPALMEFFRRDVYCPLNGILVDMPTYMRSSEEEKRLLTELVGLFPALRLKCNESTGEIRTLPFGTAFPGNTSPAVFVQKYCTVFVARKIRTCERSKLHLPALLGRSLPLENLFGARSVTANISRGGCFLVSFAPWLVGDRGWLVLSDLNDTTPISVEVCSIRLWGECNTLPGMGVRFIDLTVTQQDEVGRLGGASLMQDDH